MFFGRLLAARTAAPQKDPTREKWMQELRELQCELDNNERLFNMTYDFDVTDFAIHERNALNTRYRYLLRRIRECDGQQTAETSGRL